MNDPNSTASQKASKVVRRAGDAADKLETIESLREGARTEIERAMLKVQRELGVLETTPIAEPKALRAIARNLRKAWGLLDCQALEIGGLERKLEESAPAVTQ